MSKTRKPFVDFRAIRERLTMEQVLEHYGVLHTLKRKGNRLSGPCPTHHGSNPTQFRVETDRNIWNCFSECKHGGNTLDFIAKKEDFTSRCRSASRVSTHEKARISNDFGRGIKSEGRMTNGAVTHLDSAIGAQ